MKRICVFCGSNFGTSLMYAEAAVAMGEAIFRSGRALVYGGGCVGLMGRIADTVLGLGGEVIGVIPEALVAREVAHSNLRDLRVVKSMHERKALMAELSDAFVALPGGFGTFEEFCEVLTWSQLGLHDKPCGLLNVNGYYDPLISFFDHGVKEGFIPQQHRRLVLAEPCVPTLMEALEHFKTSPRTKWIDRKET